MLQGVALNGYGLSIDLRITLVFRIIYLYIMIILVQLIDLKASKKNKGKFSKRSVHEENKEQFHKLKGATYKN